MGLGFFIVGGIIFTAYVYFLIWSIFDSNKRQREENYPNLIDDVDMDGMGNYGRIPNKKPKYVSKRSNVSGRRRVRTEER